MSKSKPDVGFSLHLEESYRMIPNKMQPAAAWRTIHCHVKAYVLNEITC